MNELSRTLDVVVIGGGQAGLALGWHLQQHGLDFLIIDEQARPGGNWRNYYDSLQLFSPAEYSALPGLPFPGDPKSYPLRDEVVKYLEAYAAEFRLPFQGGTRVVGVAQKEKVFEIRCDTGVIFTARSVVVASGGFSRPFTPSIPGLEGFTGTCLHSSAYRTPEPFAGQRVVVVGAANSAVQIAYELAGVAEVVLATREKIRFFPQRILGLDFHTWLKFTRLEQTRWLSDQSTPVLDTGKYRKALDTGRFQRRAMFQQVLPDGVVWPDRSTTQIGALIFATGFQPNLDFLSDLPVEDRSGRVLQNNGVASQMPGLYFVGLPKQRNFASATLRGVGADAGYLMPRLLQYLSKGRSSHLSASPRQV
ncbi:MULTISPECIES: flavin-containing monooxygenase [Pseudomonas]|jgi:putative flavoprotein involved in K+ transport|uniref:NAD(P)-binding domain-containing protein n=1 Tax=Pseudomonas auratipiscis TaxID=3115853 RepID=A0AB35WV85_9PSED|nr:MULTISPECIES: NAD(P)-binding domain-containing protein [Pseudomonas]MDO1434432.1 NAD(P)-binding domain-containing protein [Pseudomonas aeruginosa]MEE1867583.1 NAD(P)-binding domain-containing protein [Pseudomonas sp. 120P]MEE1958410.1 NAD(P)-binding domain-containing protein [Pseudomonas sp. 119P]